MYANDNQGYENINQDNIGAAPGDPRSGGFMAKSFKTCTIFGIEIHIHILLPLFFLVTLIVWLPMMASDTQNIGWYFVLIILYNLVLWESVLIHELGHCLAAYSIGGHSDKILLWPLGGLAFSQPPAVLNNANGDAERRKHQIIISLGGPITHIPHMILFAMILLWYCSSSTAYTPTNCPYNSIEGTNPFKAWIFWEETLITNCDGEGGLCLWLSYLYICLSSSHLNDSQIQV